MFCSEKGDICSEKRWAYHIGCLFFRLHIYETVISLSEKGWLYGNCIVVVGWELKI